MNITTALPTIPPSPMPTSDFVGRDNQQRALIKASPETKENGSATDKPQAANKPDSKQQADSDKRTDATNQAPEDKQPSERSREEQLELEEQIQELRSRDQEVRTHEQAHASVGGQYAGSPSYEYERGPDGKSYAVGGEVPIDISAVPGDPQATIQKMATVRRAALAPAQPSPADRAIAAEATVKATQARAELAQQTSNFAKQETEAGEAAANSNVQGPITRSLESDGEASNTSSKQEAADTAVSSERRSLSSPERGEMIASYYQKRVSPSETGFKATA